MRYCQHEETGLCCCVCDNIDLSRRHIEITKQQYDLHEGIEQDKKINKKQINLNNDKINKVS